MDADVIGLREQLAGIQRQNELAEMENKIFQLYAARLLTETEEDQGDQTKNVLRDGNKCKKERVPETLTLQQKQGIITFETGHAKDLLEETKKVSDKLIDDLKVFRIMQFSNTLQVST
jgi:hypothetical protein